MYSLTFCVRIVARTPPVEARCAGRRSNVENAPRRRPVTGQLASLLPIYAAQFWERPRYPPVTGQQRALTRRAFALCRRIAGWTQERQACN